MVQEEETEGQRLVDQRPLPGSQLSEDGGSVNRSSFSKMQDDEGGGRSHEMRAVKNHL